MAEPDPRTKQNAVGPYPVGSVIPGGNSETITADGGITHRQGRVYLDASAALDLSLGAPAQNDDLLEIIDVSGHAHVVTVVVLDASGVDNHDGINGADNQIIFGGDKGDSVALRAKGGFWYAVNLTGATLGASPA